MEDFFKALKEYEHVRKTVGSSDQHSFPLEQAKRDFENALIEIIDRRIKSSAGREKRTNNASSSIPAQSGGFIPDNLSYLEALNSAPSPPDSVDDLVTRGLTSIWFDNYYKWFHDRRKKALK